MSAFVFRQTIDDCSCGKIHRCPIREVKIGADILGEIPGHLQGIVHVLLVFDENTRAACGETVRRILRAAGIAVTAVCLPPEREGAAVLPDEDSIAKIRGGLTEQTGCIVGVSSGVINDLCKYVSFFAGLPYMIVATAPSMDGYASKDAAMILGGMKETVPARCPAYIFADTDVLREAPLRMIRAGAGDILGKYSCLNDWRLSQLINGEELCEEIFAMTLREAGLTAENARGINARESGAVSSLMNSLIAVGAAMAYAGCSRPASGSEHHLAHYFEITGILRRAPYLFHGEDVAFGAVLTARLREWLLSRTPADFRPCESPEALRARRDAVYGRISESVSRLQEQAGLDDPSSRLPVIRARWDKVLAVLRTALPSERILEALDQLGLSFGAFVRFYGKERLREAIVSARDLKNRYTLLNLLADTGLLTEAADAVLSDL